MLPDRVSNPGPLTYESGALPIALRGPAPSLRCLKQLGLAICTAADAVSETVFCLVIYHIQFYQGTMDILYFTLHFNTIWRLDV